MDFWIGLLAGVIVTVFFAWEYIMRKEPPRIEVRLTPEVAERIVEKTIREWLDRNELTVMPRGKEFTWPGEVKR